MSATDRDPEVQRIFSDLEIPPYPKQFFRELHMYLEQDNQPKAGRIRSVDEKHHSRRMYMAPIAVAAAIAVFVVAALDGSWLTDNKEQTPELSLASQVIQDSAETLRTLNGLSGKLEWTRTGYRDKTVRSRFRQDANGSFYNVLESGEGVAYDAKTSTFDKVTLVPPPSPSADGSIDPSPAGLPGSDLDEDRSDWVQQAIRTTNVFSTGPDSPLNQDGLGFLERFAYVEDLLAVADKSTLEETTVDGKPAWKIQNPELSTMEGFNNFTIVVDKESHLPVQIVIVDGIVTITGTLSDVQINPSFNRSDFSMTFPKGVEVKQEDGGDLEVNVEQAQKLVGYEPVLPKYLPSGFERTSLKAGDSSFLDSQNNTDAAVSRNVIVATYRRGLQSIVITTRSANGDTNWVDPLLGEFSEDSPHTGVTLTGGVFRGVMTELYGRTSSQAHLWGKNSDLVFSVQGDVDRTELTKVAESLTRQ